MKKRNQHDLKPKHEVYISGPTYNKKIHMFTLLNHLGPRLKMGEKTENFDINSKGDTNEFRYFSNP